MNTRIASAAAIATLVSGAAAAHLEAQCEFPITGPRPAPTASCSFDEESHASATLLALGANAAIGGLTAGLRQWHADGSFLDAFWRGAVGGVGTFAGKVIVASDVTGAGLIGRGVAAAGASVTLNASEGRPMFDRLILPVGFVRLHWRPAHGDLRTSLDVAGIATVAGIYLSGLGASLDLGRTLDTGAPVFMARDWEPERGWSGRQVFGAVILRGDEAVRYNHDRMLRLALHHERVHVLQYDQAFILWNEPLENAMHKRFGSPEWLVTRIDLSLITVGLAGLKTFTPRSFEVWETEAHLMARTGNFAER